MSDGTTVITPEQFQADLLEAANKAQWAYQSSTAAAAAAAQAFASAQSSSQNANNIASLASQTQTNANQAQYWATLTQALNALVAQFDVAGKATGVLLSNSNLTASFPGGQAGALGNVGHGAGQHYFEVTFTQGQSSSNASIGIATRKESLNSQIGYDDNSGAVAVFQDSGNIYQSGARVAGATSYDTVGTVIGVAVDSDKNLVWFRVNGGVWNSSALADPVQGAGGVPYSLTGAVYPAICTDAIAEFTVNFAGPFTAAAPTGYRPWSADAYQYVVPLATKDTPGIASFGIGMTVDAQGHVTSDQYYDMTTVQSWDNVTTVDLSNPTPVYRIVLNAPTTEIVFANLNVPANKSLRFTVYVEQGSGSNVVSSWDSKVQWASGFAQTVLGYAKGTRNVFEFESIDGQTLAGYYVTQLNAAGA